MQLFLADSILSVVDRFFMAVLCSALIWGKFVNITFSIELFALLQTLSYCLASLMALAIIYNHHGKFEFNGVPLFSRELLFKSFPFALLGFLMAIHNRIDAVFLERISSSGAYEAGIYAQSFRIFDAIGMIAVLFAVLLLPMFSKQLSKGEDSRPLVKMAFSILFTCMVILVANLVGFAFPILDFLYVDLVPKAVSVFIILMLTIIPVSLNYIFGTLLTANGSLKQLNRIAGLTLILNVILNLALIPMHGAVGAAISAFASQLFACLMQIFLCSKIFTFQITLGQSKQYFVFIGVTILMVFIFSQIQVGFITGFIVSGTLSITIALLLKMINLREIMLLFRPER
jgi:O-antigen/teichoic acid export membrane protein